MKIIQGRALNHLYMILIVATLFVMGFDTNRTVGFWLFIAAGIVLALTWISKKVASDSLSDLIFFLMALTLFIEQRTLRWIIVSAMLVALIAQHLLGRKKVAGRQ